MNNQGGTQNNSNKGSDSKAGDNPTQNMNFMDNQSVNSQKSFGYVVLSLYMI